jgi:hypothetical protein
LACVIAGSIEYDQSREVDPNWYFGAYAGLVTILLIASIFLDRVNEPEIIRLTKEERERLGHEAQDTIRDSCNMTWQSLVKMLGYNEFLFPILFFFLQGMVIPNFDDVHYLFLTETNDMPKWKYDFLNCFTYASILLVIFLYGQYFSRAQVWKLVLASMGLFILSTSLLLLNATRRNLDIGINDEVLNAAIFFFSTQPVSILAFIPMQVQLTYLVPENVEASTMALITGTFVWSYEVGAKTSSALYCSLFVVNDENMGNYPHMLIVKLVMLGLMMVAVPYVIPSNEAIQNLAKKLRFDHIEKQNSRGIGYGLSK